MPEEFNELEQMIMYTSEQILAMDDLYELQEIGSVQYKLTDDENEWLDFIRGKYSIADYLDQNMTENYVEIESSGMSEALDEDCQGMGKGVCLSDDTALQKIFFWLYMEPDHDFTG